MFKEIAILVMSLISSTAIAYGITHDDSFFIYTGFLIFIYFTITGLFAILKKVKSIEEHINKFENGEEDEDSKT